VVHVRTRRRQVRIGQIEIAGNPVLREHGSRLNWDSARKRLLALLREADLLPQFNRIST
jgi:hypothetical protein